MHCAGAARQAMRCWLSRSRGEQEMGSKEHQQYRRRGEYRLEQNEQDTGRG